MTEKWLRFGVSDGQSLWSATWKLWTGASAGRPAVYLASRFLGGRLQAGRAASGAWSLAFAPAGGGGPGVATSEEAGVACDWPQPSAIGAGCVLLFRILTPATAVTPPPVRGKHRHISWIPKAPPGKAVETAIFVTSPVAGMPAWPTRELAGRSLLGSLELVGGERVSVLYRTVGNPDIVAQPSGLRHVPATTSAQPSRSLVIGLASDGRRVIYDLAVRPGSV